MSPAIVLAATFATLGLAGAGMRQLWVDWEDRRALVERSALDAAEARAARWRVRADAALRRTRPGARLAAELAEVGSPLSVLAAAVLAAAALVGGFLVVDALAPTWLAPLGTYAAWRAMRALLERARARRRDEFVAQLPELARTLSNAASAGRSLPSALRLAATELDDPAAGELTTVAEELRVGQSLEVALDRLAARLPGREVRVLVTTLVIQQRTGGDLVRALRHMAYTLEKRKDLRGELRSVMAGAVYTGYVVIFLGVGAVALMNTISPGALDALLSHPIGIGVVAVAVALYAAGVALIRRQQRVEL